MSLTIGNAIVANSFRAIRVQSQTMDRQARNMDLRMFVGTVRLHVMFARKHCHHYISHTAQIVETRDVKIVCIHVVLLYEYNVQMTDSRMICSANFASFDDCISGYTFENIVFVASVMAVRLFS